MNARSVVFDLFGDYLRYRGGEVRLRGLVALMDGLGVSEPTVRAVVSRMRREGWLAGRPDGRETVYALTPRSWTLLDDGRARIFQRASGPWDGNWHMVIYSVPESERHLREHLRKSLAWEGFGPFAAGVWVSPHDRVDRVRASIPSSVPVQLTRFRARSEGHEADCDVTRRAWDLDALARDYRALLADYQPRLARYRAGQAQGAEALAERMRLVHDYRKFPFRDPDLPAELLPPDWPGQEAHAVFLSAHGLLRDAAEAHVATVLDRL